MDFFALTDSLVYLVCRHALLLVKMDVIFQTVARLMWDAARAPGTQDAPQS